jgi:hypothetical protein
MLFILAALETRSVMFPDLHLDFFRLLFGSAVQFFAGIDGGPVLHGYEYEYKARDCARRSTYFGIGTLIVRASWRWGTTPGIPES